MYRVGIDIGGTKIAGGVVDEQGRIVKREQIPTLRQRTAEEIIGDIGALINRLIEDYDKAEVAGVGIGVPGSVFNNVVIQCVNLDWRGVNMGEILSRSVDLRIEANNDANCAIIGEYRFGACKNVRNAVMLTLGTGVGGGIIIDGKLYMGSHGNAAELGHMPLVFDGLHCPCGGEGCVEQYCSASALIRQATEAAEAQKKGLLFNKLNKYGQLNAKDVIDAVKEGDELATQVFDAFIRYLAAAINGIINIFDPETILLGGGVSNAGDILVDAIEKELDKIQYFDKNVFKRNIVISKNGNDAGILGAAALVD